MSPQRYSVLSLFESPRGHLAQITRNLLHDPDLRVTEWIWIEYRHAQTLQPLDGRDNRIFTEGQLHFEEGEGELRWSTGRTEALVRIDLHALPRPSRTLLELHLT